MQPPPTETPLKENNKLKSFEVFPELLDFITKSKVLTVQDIDRLEDLFGDRVKKALELVGKGKVKKYIFQPSNIVRWAVIGHHNNYLLIESSFCSCKDFLFQAIMKRTIPSCYHLLAREIAEITDKFSEVTLSDQDYSSFIDSFFS